MVLDEDISDFIDMTWKSYVPRELSVPKILWCVLLTLVLKDVEEWPMYSETVLSGKVTVAL